MNSLIIPKIETSVSVIIPVYNSGQSAIRSIESVLAQTFVCAEIIVVDDGSTDGSADQLREYFRDRAAAIQIYSIENSGAAGARNFGLAQCNSEWVSFLDSDDLWYSNKLETQLCEVFVDPTISLIGTLTTMPNFSSYSFPSHARLKTITLKTLLFKNYFQTSTVLVRRQILRELGGFPCGQRYAEEGDLFMRIASKHKCVLINEILVDYDGGKSGFGAAGLSAKLWPMEYGELRNICRAWRRGDSGSVLISAALMFSIVKFFRRVLIKLAKK